ncbi:MAG: hypothetical protein ACT4OF_16365 [Caulobacteraceae bacterium]
MSVMISEEGVTQRSVARVWPDGFQRVALSGEGGVSLAHTRVVRGRDVEVGYACSIAHGYSVVWIRDPFRRRAETYERLRGQEPLPSNSFLSEKLTEHGVGDPRQQILACADLSRRFISAAGDDFENRVNDQLVNQELDGLFLAQLQ